MIFDLARILERSILASVPEDKTSKIAVSFSGGIDSTVLATVTKKHSNIHLFTVGVEGSQDLGCSRKLAFELNLPLTEIVVDEKLILETYEKVSSLNPRIAQMTIEILIPIYLVAKAASKSGFKKIFFGSGAEEVFVGYHKYYLARESGRCDREIQLMLEDEFRTLKDRDIAYIRTICTHFSIEPVFPFYNQKLADFMFSIPLPKRMDDKLVKKGLLRQAAKLLNVPTLAVERKKQAMQYGSGIHKFVMKNILATRAKVE